MIIPEEKYIAMRLGEEKDLQATRLAHNPKRAAEEANKSEGLSILNMR